MSILKNLIISSFKKKVWHIRVKSAEGFVQVEVTDPSFLWANVDDLLIDVIEMAFRDCNYLSVSQFVDKDQWNLGEQDDFIWNISEDFSLPTILTRSFESFEEIKISDRTFAIHVIHPPEKRWLKKVIRFGMTNNPNILYGLYSIPKNWPFDLIEWNLSFGKWFRLETDESQIKQIFEQVNLFGWTGDGHVNIGFREEKGVEKLLRDITKLAEEKTLRPIIEQK